MVSIQLWVFVRKRIHKIAAVMGRTANISRQDWVNAAFACVADGGLAALAVEPLARSLGVSKGGFYWCFASRDELLTELLTQWEARGTREIIEAVEQLGAESPVRALLVRVAQKVKSSSPGALITMRVEHAFHCASNDPRVAPVVQRVNTARLSYLERLLRREGLGPKLARQRAILGHATYIGLVQLRATGHDQAVVMLDSEELVEAYRSMLLANPTKGRKRPAADAAAITPRAAAVDAVDAVDAASGSVTKGKVVAKRR
jgi:AcrR family transcriptional regulator